MKRINLKKIVVCFLAFMCIFLGYKKYNGYKIILNASNQPPIIFAADFNSGDKGTFKYNVKTSKAEKISDYIFHELSYSEDYEKIIGVIWEDRFQGIAELDMKNYVFRPIVDLEELNKCAKSIGLDEIKYQMHGVTDIHMPKFYKGGYTFFWKDSRDVICYFYKENDVQEMEVLYKTDHGNYSYFIKEGNDKDLLFVESRHEIYNQKIERININKNNLETLGDEELLITSRKNFSNSTGNMDVSNDTNRIVYYQKPNISIYDIDKNSKININSQYLFWQDMVYIKFSQNERYVFYAVGNIPFFWADGYRLIFYIVDSKTGNKIRLDKWKNGDTFYGIDW